MSAFFIAKECLVRTAISVCFALALLIQAGNADALQISINAATPVQLSFDKSTELLSIKTDSTHWKIRLQTTSILGSSATVQQALFDIPSFYRGTVLTDDSSWVRLNSDIPFTTTAGLDLHSAALHGHIFFEDSLYKLRHDGTHGYFLMPLERKHASTGFYSTQAQRQRSLPNDPSNLLQNASEKTQKAIKIGIVIDSRYNERYNGRGLAEALGVINGVDGMFQSQLGLSIIVERFSLMEDPGTDPLRQFPGSMEQMLYRFRNHRIEDSELPADLALVHLFTGHSNPNELIGLSWIDTVCQSDGYDVSVSTPFPYSMLLSAHEIAHNLGAVHDDDQQCLSDTSVSGNEVMWSELSHNTQATFSSCSINRMEVALRSSCVINNIDTAISIKSTATGKPLEQRVEISAINWDLYRVAPNISSSTLFPNGTELSNASAGCLIDGTKLECQHGNIAAKDRNTLTVTALFSNPEPSTIRSDIEVLEFADTNKLDNYAAVSVDFEGEVSSNSAIAFAASSNEIPSRFQAGAGASAGSYSPITLLVLSLVLVPSFYQRHRYTAS